jgi:hypothetical protein
MSAAAHTWWQTVITPQNPTKALDSTTTQNPDDGSSSKTLAHSLAKPTFYLGLGQAPQPRTLSSPQTTENSNRVITDHMTTQPDSNTRQLFADRPADLDDSVTNIVAMGAHKRTAGAIALMHNGAAGFKNVGDRICWKIKVSYIAAVHWRPMRYAEMCWI